MATRMQIIQTIGAEYQTSNIENGEWKYSSAFRDEGKRFTPVYNEREKRSNDSLDLRFEQNGVAVLVETKRDFDKDIEAFKAQLQAYVSYEKALTGDKVVAILANTDDDRIMVWRGIVDDTAYLANEARLRTFEEYAELYASKVNDKERVMRSTYELNEMLHGDGIPEKLRSQLVGTCLLALKNGLKYEDRSTGEIIAAMRSTLEGLLDKDINRAEKLVVLDKHVLESQAIKRLSPGNFRTILRTIEDEILPFINDRSTAGQDLLNLFFITFNKYVGKADKNQAFTPDHITDFMAKVCDVNRNSRVLDATCGSGSFLVRAMTQAMDDCATKAEQDEVKRSHIFGIENDETAFGLATTNMLIHGDGNTNVRMDSVFNAGDWIRAQDIDVVLMNPPYNGTRPQCQPSYVRTWSSKKKEDPSKGFHYVKFVADHVMRGKMAVLLPMQCAIGTNREIKKFKRMMLQEHTLDAVFTLPADVFHPGAAVQVCCMVFDLGRRHDPTRPTFFGYFREDGFVKRKNLGRVERVGADGKGLWPGIEKEWLDLYRGMKEVEGKSAVHCVTADDEWLAEAYMKTDYSSLSESDFQQTINHYFAYLVKSGKVHEA